jgi:hypothetical protein
MNTSISTYVWHAEFVGLLQDPANSAVAATAESAERAAVTEEKETAGC